MTTTRTPINRPRTHRFSSAAIRIFKAMLATADCTCEQIDWNNRYWEHVTCPGCEEFHRINSDLWSELKLPPWDWPAVVSPAAVSPFPKDSPAAKNWKPNIEAQARWLALKAALAEADRRTRAPD